jgi:hypothetical protein
MSEDQFTLEIREIVRKHYPDYLGHTISVDLPKKDKDAYDLDQKS